MQKISSFSEKEIQNIERVCETLKSNFLLKLQKKHVRSLKFFSKELHKPLYLAAFLPPKNFKN